MARAHDANDLAGVSVTSELIPRVPVQRPNGKWYRPRKIVAVAWDDPWPVDDDYCGVYILGTHDIDASREFANSSIAYFHDSGMVATKPEKCWIRDGYHNNDRTWISDDVRGRAAVGWTAQYLD